MLAVLGSNMKLHPKRGYKQHWAKLNGSLHDVESYTRRAEYSKVIGAHKNGLYKYDKYDHLAVVVLTDGRCYVGIARCGKRDQFNRSRGHEIAVGRAMKRALKEMYKPKRPAVSDSTLGVKVTVTELASEGDFWINTAREPLPTGVALRDRCREELREMGVRL